MYHHPAQVLRKIDASVQFFSKLHAETAVASSHHIGQAMVAIGGALRRSQAALRSSGHRVEKAEEPKAAPRTTKRHFAHSPPKIPSSGPSIDNWSLDCLAQQPLLLLFTAACSRRSFTDRPMGPETLTKFHDCRRRTTTLVAGIDASGCSASSDSNPLWVLTSEGSGHVDSGLDLMPWRAPMTLNFVLVVAC